MPNPFKEYVRFIGVERVRIYDSSVRLVSIVNDVWDGKNQKKEKNYLPALILSSPQVILLEHTKSSNSGSYIIPRLCISHRKY